MTQIAFLGAGIMGSAMIRNFLKSGHSVTTYNRTMEKARALEPDGAKVAKTPAEAVAGAEMIMSMVIDDNASRACWAGPDGALEGKLRQNALAIESSSVSRDWVLELGELAAAKGIKFIDCPVAGRPDVAESGELALFAGGRVEDVNLARHTLGAIGKRLTHFGPLGAGIAFKLIYNVTGTVQVAALAEGMHACEQAGIDLKAAHQAFEDGATGSPHVARHSKYMAYETHEDPVQFSGNNRIKDLTYGIELMDMLDSQAVLGRAARNVFAQMNLFGMGDLNDSELINTLRKQHSSK